MKKIKVTINGQEALVKIDNGKVEIEGYDLENEKMVLALTRFHSGFGALLIAIDECRMEEDLAKLVREFRRGIKEWEKVNKTFVLFSQKHNQVLLTYLSLSPDFTERRAAAASATLSPTLLKRFMNDIDEGPLRALAGREDLPLKEQEILARKKDVFTKLSLLSNPNLPRMVLDILHQDQGYQIRPGLAKYINCPQDILEDLALCPDPTIVMAALARKDLDVELKLKIIKKGERLQKTLLVDNSSEEEVLFALAKDKDEFIAKIAKDKIELLATGENIS